ncbi:MAG: hypothetical protein KC620_11595 [Myxococcales bacterium]|nr:hypothetical protein [Myxococcales bacterium]
MSSLQFRFESAPEGGYQGIFKASRLVDGAIAVQNAGSSNPGLYYQVGGSGLNGLFARGLDSARALASVNAALVKAYDARFGVGAWRRDAAKPPAEARLTSLQVSLPRSPEAIDPEVSAMMYSVGPVLGPAGLTDPATYAAIYADAFAEIARSHAEGHAIAGLRITMLSTGIYAARVADPPALFAQAAACIVDGLLAATRAHPELAKVIVLINTEAHPSSKERVAFARAAKARGLQFDSSGFSVPLA